MVCCLILSAPGVAWCNDAPITISGGSATLMDERQTNISLDSEIVRIELGDTTYTVDATFRFFNHGASETVTVGFPNHGIGFFSELQDFLDFKTWVNDEKSEFKEIRGSLVTTGHRADSASAEAFERDFSEARFRDETRWFVKEVTFQGKKETTTRVRYVAPYVFAGRTAIYLYGTGKAWKGEIGRAAFVIRTSPDAWVNQVRFPSGVDREIRGSRFFRRLGEYEFEYVLTDFEPEEDEALDLLVSTGNLSWKDQPWEREGDFHYSDHPLPDEMLQRLSFQQLRFLRNAYYALHGRKFESPDLDEFFRKRGWYKPREDFRETDLTEVQRENVKRISEYEEKLKEVLKK
ncbi:MAG: hypothetical protein A3F84_07945 [Candidatus Handelsmanbacteria bacterium RIFCSPLOWO2_12_FULL_64_10]|uniref:YARHG domain-containing protein n=1 Tax=Handelsmanbacteria sp. (strain RIFCSPLOWO2_12_FULL_64_10) TaxID=1817868 RepID=A0A1F6CAP4_HANXR|nr:MAG: hypothetical protein A3F84_07945 [Candidatus Handelsmanbacteria bacterium RIFCSPLOWO2_12_FULL_64_10]